MELQLYGRVLWRHRLLLGAGVAVALALALLAVLRVDFKGNGPTFSYRQPEVWQASTRLMLTQRGFPMGRSGFSPTEGGAAFSDPGRMSSLASFYAQLANADAVQLKVFGASSETAALTAAPVIDPSTEEPAPFVDILGLAEKPLAAAKISNRGAKVFIDYISQRQAAAGIPARDRVLLQIVKEPLGIEAPELVQARKKTTPAFVFLAVLVATFGLIFVVENARRRGGPMPVPTESDQGVPLSVRERMDIEPRREERVTEGEEPRFGRVSVQEASRRGVEARRAKRQPKQQDLTSEKDTLFRRS